MRPLALGMHTWAPGWVLIETKGKDGRRDTKGSFRV